eukprot:14733129-Heterocapsa_arctica.AAC.1
MSFVVILLAPHVGLRVDLFGYSGQLAFHRMAHPFLRHREVDVRRNFGASSSLQVVQLVLVLIVFLDRGLMFL